MKSFLHLERDSDLVLRKPQHYHAEVYCYQSMAGDNFVLSTLFNLVGNDLILIRSRAKDLASDLQTQTFIKSVSQCADPLHLEGL